MTSGPRTRIERVINYVVDSVDGVKNRKIHGSVHFTDNNLVDYRGCVGESMGGPDRSPLRHSKQNIKGFLHAGTDGYGGRHRFREETLNRTTDENFWWREDLVDSSR